jgi:hypothetical protein
MKLRHKLMKKTRETVLKDAGDEGGKAQPGEPACNRVLALPSFPSELVAKAFLQRFALALKKEGL